MKGTPAIYLGRMVEKSNFRVFIYGANGEKKLVESWDEFESMMQSGLWFASLEDAQSIKRVEENLKPKSKAKSKVKAAIKPQVVEEVEDQEDVLLDDGLVYEVTDDFLPNEGK